MPIEKNILRKELILKRQLVTEFFAKESSILLMEHFLPLIPQGAAIAGYFPMRGEVDILPLLANLVENGHITCLPAIEDNTKILKFLKWQTEQPLYKGKFGEMQPLSESGEITPNVIIVPLVGGDRNGNRLGYGGGYYDATISYYRQKTSYAQNPVRIIGAAYSFQILDSIKTEPHDEKLDLIVTEKGIVK